jgi:hypothetical protein
MQVTNIRTIIARRSIRPPRCRLPWGAIAATNKSPRSKTKRLSRNWLSHHARRRFYGCPIPIIWGNLPQIV